MLNMVRNIRSRRAQSLPCSLRSLRSCCRIDSVLHVLPSQTLIIIRMTGPEAYHFKGVEPVLKRNGCSVKNETAVAEDLQFVHERHLCEQTQQPERIGIVQASRHTLTK